MGKDVCIKSLAFPSGVEVLLAYDQIPLNEWSDLTCLLYLYVIRWRGPFLGMSQRVAYLVSCASEYVPMSIKQEPTDLSSITGTVV